MLLLQATAPLLSNDLEGLLKIGGVVLTFLGGVWAIVRGPLQRQIGEVAKGAQDDIDGVGRRATLLEARCTANETAIAQLTQDKRADEVETRALHATLGEVKGELRAMRERSEEQNLEWIAHMNNLGTEMRGQASTSRETLAGLNGKVETLGKFAEMLAKQRQ